MITFLHYTEIEKVLNNNMFNKHAISMLHDINMSVDNKVVSKVDTSCSGAIDNVMEVFKSAVEQLELKLYGKFPEAN